MGGHEVSTDIQTSSFGGTLSRHQHQSTTLGCCMKFTLFRPEVSYRLPVLYWLSDCNSLDTKFLMEGLPQRAAMLYNIAIITPDTYPRYVKTERKDKDCVLVPNCCGYFLNGSEGGLENWNMYNYVVEELPSIINQHFGEKIDTSRASISGLFTGGHAALMIYLKNTQKYKSVSAFSPVTNPINNSLDKKVFLKFMGTNELKWKEFDATCLVHGSKKLVSPILIEQGSSNMVPDGRLSLHNFKEACCESGVKLILNMRPGYKPDYSFVATFIDDHVAFHASYLCNLPQSPTVSPSTQIYQSGFKSRKQKKAKNCPGKYKLYRKEWNVLEKRGYFVLTNPELPNVEGERVFFQEYESADCVRVMQSTNHRNILSLRAVHQNPSSSDKPSPIFRFVEPYQLFAGETRRWFTLGYLACKNRMLPSQRFQDMIRQIMEGLDHVHTKGFYHGKLSWSAVLDCMKDQAQLFQLTGFKNSDSKDVKRGQLKDWNDLGHMLRELSRNVQMQLVGYDCTLVDELGVFLEGLMERSMLGVIKNTALDLMFFWDNSRRSYFFRIEVPQALKCRKFYDMVVACSDVCSLPWDSLELDKLKEKMSEYREENVIAQYNNKLRIHFIDLVCAAYTHEDEIQRKHNFSVDNAIRVANPRLCIILKRIMTSTSQ